MSCTRLAERAAAIPTSCRWLPSTVVVRILTCWRWSANWWPARQCRFCQCCATNLLASPGGQSGSAPGAAQRREDAGEAVGPIPVPPKYAAADFKSTDIWRLRGKLDVPKERFISYPSAERDSDRSLVVGWAGWNHLQQAMALAAYYDRMKHREGWAPERLVPLLVWPGPTGAVAPAVAQRR